MTSYEFLELDHSKLKPAVYDGLALLEYLEPIGDHLAKVKAMKVRDDDVLLCTFPKSGTHWIFRVMDMLRRGQANYVRRNADSTFIDVQDLEAMSHLESPRILLSHLPFDRLPDQLHEKRTKMVHMYRNPRAVLTSSYFHMTDVTEADLKTVKTITIDTEADFFFSEKMYSLGWFTYMDKVGAFKKQYPDQPIFDVSYEEMSENPLKMVAKLGEFLLDEAVSLELCEDIVAACSFQKQKSSEESIDPSQATLKFYRKGDVNDWKNHVPVALDEKIERILQERREKCSYSEKYCRKQDHWAKIL